MTDFQKTVRTGQMEDSVAGSNNKVLSLHVFLSKVLFLQLKNYPLDLKNDSEYGIYVSLNFLIWGFKNN